MVLVYRGEGALFVKALTSIDGGVLRLILSSEAGVIGLPAPDGSEKSDLFSNPPDTYIEYDRPNLLSAKTLPYVDALRRRKVKFAPRLGRALVKSMTLSDCCARLPAALN